MFLQVGRQEISTGETKNPHSLHKRKKKTKETCWKSQGDYLVQSNPLAFKQKPVLQLNYLVFWVELVCKTDIM